MIYYDYKCSKCGQISEIQHGMNDKPEIYCTVCSSDEKKVIMKRLISLPGIHFTDDFRFGRQRDSRGIAGLKEKIQQDPNKDPYRKYREDPKRDLKIR